MSDVARCPFCKKVIDTTLTLEKCPKCNAGLEGVVLESVSDSVSVNEPTEPISFWDNPAAYFLGYNRSAQTAGGIILAVIIGYFFGLLGVLIFIGLALVVKKIFTKN